jgi:UDP-N-acetylmuramoylalanine--D-glutamate ligase
LPSCRQGRGGRFGRFPVSEKKGAVVIVTNVDAVKQAYRVVSPDNVILLSAGCARFDMYDNYVQRGEDFRKAVENFKLKIS